MSEPRWSDSDVHVCSRCITSPSVLFKACWVHTYLWNPVSPFLPGNGEGHFHFLRRFLCTGHFTYMYLFNCLDNSVKIPCLGIYVDVTWVVTERHLLGTLKEGEARQKIASNLILRSREAERRYSPGRITPDLGNETDTIQLTWKFLALRPLFWKLQSSVGPRTVSYGQIS